MKEMERLEELKKEMERLEELKRVVINKTYYKEGIPLEVIEIVQESFNGLLNKYQQLNCNFSTTEEYTEGNMKQVENTLIEKIGERRKEIQVEDLQNIFRKMERQLEESEGQLDKKRDEEYEKEILSMHWGEQEITEIIMEMIKDSLKSIQTTQNRILDDNGYDINKIEIIKDNIRSYIYQFTTENEDRIYEILQKDSKDLKEQILIEYEKYLLQKEQEENRENTGEDREAGEIKDLARNKFIQSLDSNISLESQSDFAHNKFAELEEEKSKGLSKSLPSDVII